jgi:excinuclease ABC subunit A
MADTNRIISVQGAREHNLKNVSIELPRDALIVFTGLSGSGKSSLAFDTIYAEGQRRYVESLSAYARQFLEMMQKPDVDQIDGLSPAISIEQKTTSRNPRSTVGTVTEIYDYMRLLFARAGIAYSPATGLPIESQTVSQMVDRVMELEEGTRLYLLAPIVRGRKGEYRKEFADLMKQGFQRVKVDGAFTRLPTCPRSTRSSSTISTWWWTASWCARILRPALADSFETALKLSDGLAIAGVCRQGWQKPTVCRRQRQQIAQRNPRAHHLLREVRLPGIRLHHPEVEPRLFSFNNPFGACPTCDGLGTELRFDETWWCRTSHCPAPRRGCRGRRQAIPRPTTRRRWKRCAALRRGHEHPLEQSWTTKVQERDPVRHGR